MRANHILPFVIGLSMVWLASCDSGTSKRYAQEMIEQKTLLDSLTKRLEELDTRVFELEISKDSYKSATFDPASDEGYSRLDTSVGSFAVSVQQVAPHADGVRIRLHIGNLTTATVSGGNLKVKWGVRRPKMEGKDWVEKRIAWLKSLNEKDSKFTEELRPGTWNNVTLILPGLPPDKLGHLDLQMETSQIKLLAPR